KRQEEGKVRIKTLGGTNVDTGTLQTIISPRGVSATWRMSRALFSEIKFKTKEGVITDVTQFFDDNTKAIERFIALNENKDNVGWETEYKMIVGEKAKSKEVLDKWKKGRVKELFNPLLEGNKMALGVMVSGGGLAVPPELKEILWEEISEINPGAMASILTRLEVDKDAKREEKLAGVEAMEDILIRVWGGKDPYDEGYDPANDQHSLLRGKVKKDLNGKEIENPKEKIKALENKLNELVEQQKKETVGGKKQEIEEKIEKLTGETSIGRINLRGGGVRQLKTEIKDLEEKLEKFEGKEGKRKGKISERDIGDMKKMRDSIDAKKKEFEAANKQLKLLLRCPEWKKLRDKMNTANSRRLDYEVKRIKDMREGLKPEESLDPKSFLDSMDLDLKERQVIDAIQSSGKLIAKDLANIKKCTTWFMDDVPLELIKWTNLGQFYDRETGDLANFNKAAQELLKVVGGEPFSSKPEDMLKAIREAMGGAANIIGIEAAQENMEPILTKYLGMM
ncbi:MAG: hypothetical protein U1C56_00465, partial [Candidatus Curtissbacteria bacterium]|nr:hypothetical protein [Candidatus Curtissbacteria bacterium]